MSEIKETPEKSKSGENKSEIKEAKEQSPKQKSGVEEKPPTAADQEKGETDLEEAVKSEAAKNSKAESTTGTSNKSKIEKVASKQSKKSADGHKSDKKKKSKVSSEIKRSHSTDSGQSVERKTSKSHSKIDDIGQVKIGFVGAGRMTECITRGLLKSEKINAKQLFVSARSSKNFDLFKGQGITTSTRPYEIFAKLDCDVVFLCMHGFVIRNCFKMGGTRPFPFTTNYIPWKRKQVVILSLVGGILVNDIKITLLNPEQTQKYQVSIHRMMINVAAAYNLGYGLLDVELDSKKCPTIIRDLLQLLGRIEYLDAAHMDAACALGGNGLAFVYYFITAMADGGFKMGLTRDRAVKLACKTVQSAALALLESNKTPMDLRDETAGPSGPAIYGMNVMDKKDFCGGVAHAVETSYKRILELVECDLVK